MIFPSFKSNRFICKYWKCKTYRFGDHIGLGTPILYLQDHIYPLNPMYPSYPKLLTPVPLIPLVALCPCTLCIPCDSGPLYPMYHRIPLVAHMTPVILYSCIYSEKPVSSGSPVSSVPFTSILHISYPSCLIPCTSHTPVPCAIWTICTPVASGLSVQHTLLTFCTPCVLWTFCTHLTILTFCTHVPSGTCLLS